MPAEYVYNGWRWKEVKTADDDVSSSRKDVNRIKEKDTNTDTQNKPRRAWPKVEHTTIQPFNPLYHEEETDKDPNNVKEIVPDASPSTSMPSPSAAAPLGTINAFDTKANEAAMTAWKDQVKHLFASGLTNEGLAVPAPSDGFARCEIRETVSFGQVKSIDMYIEDDMFLMAARSRKKTIGTTYLISNSDEEIKRDTDSNIAKLKCGFADSRYTLFCKSHAEDINSGYGTEKAFVAFETPTSGTGMRTVRMALVMPNSEFKGQDGELRQALDKAAVKELSPEDERGLSLLMSKRPRWDKQRQEYMLTMIGRKGSVPSAKNMQLVAWDHNAGRPGSTILLQICKISDHKYALDFAFPFTAETAFALALSIMDSKMGAKVCAVVPQKEDA